MATTRFILVVAISAVVRAADLKPNSQNEPCTCGQVPPPAPQARQYQSYPAIPPHLYKQPQYAQPQYQPPYSQQFPRQYPQQYPQQYPNPSQYPPSRQLYPSGLDQTQSQYPPYQRPYPSDPNQSRSRSRAGAGRSLDWNAPQYQEPLYTNEILPPSQIAEPAGKEKKRPFLTPPTVTFRIGIIADLGSEAKVEAGRFQSFLKEGTLSFVMGHGENAKYNVSVEFEDDVHHIIESGLNNKDEGFELSTLNVFNGKLYSCDDETGIIYEIVRKEHNETTPKNETYYAQPWIILSSEDESTGFKCEWATVKDDQLWLGSTGILVRKADTDDETKIDNTRQGVKIVSSSGQVTHKNWTENYEKIMDAMGVAENGFAVHEAVAWSDILQKWLLMPRRVSHEKFDRSKYHKKGGNAGIFADDGFKDLKLENFGNLTKTSGFTSVKFIPGTDDQLVLALKAGLDQNTNELISTLEVFDLKGNEIMPETKVATGIYAGVEFI